VAGRLVLGLALSAFCAWSCLSSSSSLSISAEKEEMLDHAVNISDFNIINIIYVFIHVGSWCE
jgi:hypothetical protein